MLLVDERVGVVRGGGLYRALQQGAWVADEELFQRVIPGDEHPQRIISSRPALPHCCRRLAMVPGYPTVMAASRTPTSMPNSRALVVTTAHSSPWNSRFSMSLLCSGV